MNKRLEQFLVAENITQSQLADKLGVARAGVSHVLAGRNKPGYDFIYNLTTNFPDLNLDWLITGKGKMYRSLMTAPASASAPLQEHHNQQPTAPESDISVPTPATDENIELQKLQKQVLDIVQPPVKQRVVTKIVVFFDDNTFQEL